MKTYRIALWVVGWAGIWLWGAVPVFAAEPATQKATVSLPLAVDGMACADCEAKVKAALSKLKGVKAVQVSYKKNEAVVEYDPGAVTPKQILQAVKKAGYEAKLKPEPKEKQKKSEVLAPHGSTCGLGRS